MKEDLYEVDSPPMQMEKVMDILGKCLNDPEIKAALAKADEDYLHWEALKYKNWIPSKYNLDKELFWTLVRAHRSFKAITTPIKDSQGHFFKMNTSGYNEFLHSVDKEMAGHFMGISGLSESDKRQFISRSIIEESTVFKVNRKWAKNLYFAHLILPDSIIPDHGIEGDNHSSHDGDERDFLLLAFFN